MRLGIGSAQFGLNYGVSNTHGRTSVSEVGTILTLARDSGIRVLDTAAAYGEAESVLGLVGTAGFDVVTKLLPGTAPMGVEPALRASLERLRLDTCYGLLLHDADDVASADGAALAAALQRVRDLGLVAKIGVSVYSPRQLGAALARMTPDLVQVPVNVFDQRLLEDGSLERLKELGVEIHARSAFLQGLLLMEPNELPATLAGARTRLSRFRRLAEKNGVTPTRAALGFVTGLREVDIVICGVNDGAQLAELLDSSDPLPPHPFKELSLSNLDIIDPTRWSQ